MNYSEPEKSLARCWYAQTVGLIYALIGLPLALGLAFLLLSQKQNFQIAPYKVSQLKAWAEPLPADASFTQEYFKQLQSRPGNFGSADWQATTLPTSIEMGAAPDLAGNAPMARAWFKFKAVVPESVDPTNPLVMYAGRVMGGPYSVWVNGELVFAQLDDWRMLWNKPIFVPIPNHLAKPGVGLEILFALPHRVSLGYAMGSVYMGSYKDLQPTRDLRYLLQIGLPLASMLMIGLAGVFSLGIWFKRRHESVHLWLFVMAVSLVASNLQFTNDIASSANGAKWYASLVDSATSWVFMSFFILVQRYTGYAFPKITATLAIFTGLSTVVTLPVWNWQVYALLLQHTVFLAVYFSVMLTVTWMAVRQKKYETWLFCIAIWLLYFSGAHDVVFLTSQRAPDHLFIFSYGAFVLFFVTEFLLRKRYQLALTQVEQSNQVLSQKLKQREDEVLVQQKRLQQASEQAALLAERARLSRDIHDGIGSALTGALINLRSENTSPSQAAEQVQHCLDDIRLVIDSMEQSQSDLPSLLASLRRRFADAFAAAGVQLIWEIDELVSLPNQGTSFTLNIVRVLQEAHANCLKHAVATQLRVTAKASTLAGGVTLLTLTIEDDGKGFDTSTAQLGRGLRNVRQRASDLKGELHIASSANGSSITLLIACTTNL